MEEKTDRLFAAFPPVSPEAWDLKIREDLKGADYEKKLIWKTLEGFKVKPFYSLEDLRNLQYLNQEPGCFPFLRGGKTTGNTWETRQDFRVHEVTAAAQRARIATSNGVTSIGFDIGRKGALSYPEFKALIHDFDFANVSLNLAGGDLSPEMLDFLLEAIEELKIRPESVKGSLGFDPPGQLTCTGGFYRSENEDFTHADEILLAAENELPGYRVLPVNSFLFGNAGASVVQELAYGLSIAAEYFTRLTDMGHDATDIARHMQWNLGAGSNYFIEIARVRAARHLFSNLLAAYGGKQDTQIFIHSITTDWNKTIFDSHVNILRLTTEAMAAVLGGCDSLLVKPYDYCYREPGGFSERISRNIQHILREESYLDRVVDPAAGSYYIESLTDSVVEHSWQLFLKTDDAGGYIKAFMSGMIRDDIQAMQSQRRQMVASRREILLGTNQYPDFSETMKGEISTEIAFPEPGPPICRIAEPLIMTRAAEDFEKLRLATENHPGRRPRAFMLGFGNLAMRLARSQFSCNFFACAGYEVLDNLGFKTVEEGVDAALKAKANLVVACSSDEEYQAAVPVIHEKVNGKAIVVVAGAPACMEALKEQGIVDFIHYRSNVLETLAAFHRKLGIVHENKNR
jgi:methylmalonyl-CoA mutase